MPERPSHEVCGELYSSETKSVQLGGSTVAPSAQNDLEYRVLRRSIIERLSREDERLLKFYILTIDYAMHIEEVAAELGVSRRSAFRLRDQLKAILVEFL